MNRVITVREHESLAETELEKADLDELRDFALKVLKRVDGDIAASNFVGVITTRRGSALEILPKVDLGSDEDDSIERTRQIFLGMLRSYRRAPKQLPHSDIRALSQYPMLEWFIRQFLYQLEKLIRNGLARQYVNVEENLPYLRGRILFADHLRRNIVDRTRFYTTFDELSVNRPANRLIHAALERLAPLVRDQRNRQLLRESLFAFTEVPASRNLSSDWQTHRIDRSMTHYRAVMEWVRLVLFGYGLTTFVGAHTNVSLLFPMEEVFEDFVGTSLRRYQSRYRVVEQGLRKSLATFNGTDVFQTKPDVALQSGRETVFILDAKWKAIDSTLGDRKHGIAQGDLYQLHTYASLYGCKAVALVYPQNSRFIEPLRYRFFDDIEVLAFPFDVSQPRASVEKILQELHTNG